MNNTQPTKARPQVGYIIIAILITGLIGVHLFSSVYWRINCMKTTELQIIKAEVSQVEGRLVSFVGIAPSPCQSAINTSVSEVGNVYTISISREDMYPTKVPLLDPSFTIYVISNILDWGHTQTVEIMLARYPARGHYTVIINEDTINYELK